MTDLRRPPKTDEGIDYVSMLPGKSDRKMLVRGIKFEADLDTNTDEDISFSETREIQGSWFEIVNHTFGDYIELFILTPADEVVGQFAELAYVPFSGKVDQIISEGTVSFPAGFKLRMRYTSVATEGDKPRVVAWYRMRK